MRVIAGSARRLNLVTPKGMDTRPTSDKIKETLFNILAPHLYGIRFLDLFAGSGGIGIEALSRGASHCTFIEKDKEAVACIRKNLETTHFTDAATVLPHDVMTSLYNLRVKDKYDIVFLDPPYHNGLCEKAFELLPPVLSKNACVICETQADETLPDGFGDHTIAKEYKYSAIKLSVYRRAPLEV